MRRIFNNVNLVILAFIFSFNTQAVSFIQFDEATIENVKNSIQANKAKEITQKAYQALIVRADALLLTKAPSVMDKTFFPPSKNKHDYLSISRYWWPDPSKADGLPWIRKDGITNPDTQTDDVDRNRLGLMVRMASDLSLAYYFSNDEKYAKKAASVLKTWFLNKETRMNPHFQYSQSVPGNPKGRRSGILDGRLIPRSIPDAMSMIAHSPHWSAEDTAQMKTWLAVYLEWLTKSKLGKKGAQQTNNHGSWYNFQVTALAYYLGDQALVEKMIEVVKQSYAFQFDDKGAQPHELKRTRSYFYSCFNLDAMTRIAMISEKAGKPFWEYVSDEGKSLSLAINFLLPATEGEAWAYKTKGVNPGYITPLLARMGKHSDNDEYLQLLQKTLADLNNDNQFKENSGILFRFALLEPQYF